MRQLTVLIVGVLLSGCRGGSSSLFVTVSGQATAVSSFELVVEQSARVSKPARIDLAGAPLDLPPDRTFSALLAASERGDYTLRLTALRANGDIAGTGMTTFSVEPGKASDARVDLLPEVVGDPDMSLAPDMTVVDLSQPPDFTGCVNTKTCQDVASVCGPTLLDCGMMMDCGPCPTAGAPNTRCVVANNKGNCLCVADGCMGRTGVFADGCGGSLNCGG